MMKFINEFYKDLSFPGILGGMFILFLGLLSYLNYDLGYMLTDETFHIIEGLNFHDQPILTWIMIILGLDLMFFNNKGISLILNITVAPVAKGIYRAIKTEKR